MRELASRSARKWPTGLQDPSFHALSFHSANTRPFVRNLGGHMDTEMARNHAEKVDRFGRLGHIQNMLNIL